MVPMADQFQKLLLRCTFKVGGPKPGTAFAVSSNLLVTARHVVEKVPPGGTVTLTAAGQPERTAHVKLLVPADDDLELAGAEPTAAEIWPDVAVLELVDGEPALDLAVFLDEAQPEEDAIVHVGGFAEGNYLSYATLKCTVGPTVNTDDLQHFYTQISQNSVDHGLSGSAVLTKQGTVCGVVNATRLPQSLLGGYFVPLPDIIAQSNLLKGFHDRPDPAAKEWIQQLGPGLLGSLERQESGARKDPDDDRPATLDMSFGQAEHNDKGSALWTITGPDGAGVLTKTTLPELGFDFPDELFATTDNWARRSQLATAEQVELLGRVLDRVILPADIRHAIELLDHHRPRLVRLRADTRDERTEIPWEYTPDLATSGQWAFSRFVPTEKPRLTPGEAISVLLVVHNFDAVKADYVVKLLHADPKSKEAGILKDDMLDRVKFETLVSPSDGTFSQALRKKPWDVVHIVTTATNAASLSFSNQLVPWSLASGMLVGSKAKAVVLQLASPRFEPAPRLSDFLSIFTDKSTINAQASPGEVIEDVRALVLAQHITSALHVTKFSTVFYTSLNTGRSVEEAVQDARVELHRSGPPSPIPGQVADFAAFGAVAVVTTAEGNVRLLAQHEKPEDEVVQGEPEQDQSSIDSHTGRSLAGKVTTSQSFKAPPRGSGRGG